MPVIVLSLLWLLPSAALAHVKWFVAAGADMPDDYVAFSITESAVLLWTMLALLLLASSIWLDRRLPEPPLALRTLKSIAMRCLALFTGSSLILSALWGNILAPHYQWPGLYADALLILEALSGLLLLFPALVFAGALLLLLLFAGLLLQAGPEALEYCNIVGIAVFLAFTHFPSQAGRERLCLWSLPLLRVCTGLALLILAFSEKLLRPDHAEEFVSSYMWNFMANLGFTTFDDRLFVLAAGSVEAVIGIVLILGTTTRLAILVISGFMLTSNVTFFLQEHLTEATTEIIGHLPIIGTALVLLCCGSGPRLRVWRPPTSPILPQSPAPITA